MEALEKKVSKGNEDLRKTQTAVPCLSISLSLYSSHNYRAEDALIQEVLKEVALGYGWRLHFLWLEWQYDQQEKELREKMKKQEGQAKVSLLYFYSFWWHARNPWQHLQKYTLKHSRPWHARIIWNSFFSCAKFLSRLSFWISNSSKIGSRMNKQNSTRCTPTLCYFCRAIVLAHNNPTHEKRASGLLVLCRCIQEWYLFRFPYKLKPASNRTSKLWSRATKSCAFPRNVHRCNCPPTEVFLKYPVPQGLL